MWSVRRRIPALKKSAMILKLQSASGQNEAAMTEVYQYLRFRLAHEWYGIEVGSIIEVLQFLSFNELPASHPDVLGVMRLRELVLPLIDLRIRFGLAASYTLGTPVIVVQCPAGSMALVVDEVV